MTSKQAVLEVIEWLPQDATMDEIVDALWTWGEREPAGADACLAAANRILALNPAELVRAHRAARDVAILGLSQQAAIDAVEALTDQAALEDILVAVATWDWPEDD